ncbi:MAG: NusG domain II-containing protein [Proteobacteria bacterium]|nr:NusG domain II-containing protein [Pseudomonadota bacterium]HQR04441.1 NusG domain II-containing protein [Rhodocyclaceae bacterium]
MNPSVSLWLSLMRPGDWIVTALGLMLAGVSYPLLWHGGAADRAVVRRDGAVVAELPLNAARRLSVPGPIGATVIETAPGRARVASDPGPRQYCVKQGWLSQAGAIAICAPNHISLSLAGSGSHDSIAY